MISNKLKLEVAERDNYKCLLCGNYTTAPPHHIIYKSEGGKDELGNLATICTKHHTTIHHGNEKSWEELFEQMVLYYKKKHIIQYFLRGAIR